MWKRSRQSHPEARARVKRSYLMIIDFFGFAMADEISGRLQRKPSESGEEGTGDSEGGEGFSMLRIKAEEAATAETDAAANAAALAAEVEMAEIAAMAEEDDGERAKLEAEYELKKLEAEATQAAEEEAASIAAAAQEAEQAAQLELLPAGHWQTRFQVHTHPTQSHPVRYTLHTYGVPHREPMMPPMQNLNTPGNHNFMRISRIMLCEKAPLPVKCSVHVQQCVSYREGWRSMPDTCVGEQACNNWDTVITCTHSWWHSTQCVRHAALLSSIIRVYTDLPVSCALCI